MDAGTNGRSTPVVRQLVKLPIIDRVKLVKDIVLGQLDAIHTQLQSVQNAVNASLANDSPLLAQLQSVQNAVNALLANDSPLLESSINLVEAVHDTRRAVDRHGEALLDSVRQARHDALRQAQELLHAVRRAGEETREREQVLLQTLGAGQENAGSQAEDILAIVQASREETRGHSQALLDDARQTREEAQRHAHELLDAVRRSREETRQQVHLLLEALGAGQQTDESPAEGLPGAIRPGRAEAREQQHLLLGALGAGLQKDESPAESLLGAIRASREETRERTQALLDDVRQAQQEAQRQAQMLLNLVRTTREETREQTQALLDDVSQARQDGQRQAQEFLDAMQGTHAETHSRADRLLEMVQRMDGSIREQSTVLLDAIGKADRGAAQRGNQIETALDKLEALAAEERRLLHDALERLRIQVQPVESTPGNAILLRAAYPEEPEVGLMAHLYSFLPSRIAVDIGANIGEVSSRLLAAGYEVFAFEPHAEVFRQLSDRLGRDAAFHAFQWALGSADETRPLHIASDQSGCNRYRDASLYSSLLHHSMPDDLVFTATVPVTVKSLVSLHASGDLPPDVSLIKIDTEGFDLEVIRGMDLHRYPVVVAEYWDKATPFGEGGAMNRLEDMVKEMKQRDYHWCIVFYRIWGKEGTSFFCNHAWSVANSFGNVFFFRDHSTFAEALKWCAAVLPVTYLSA